MRIAIAQLNYVIGGFAENERKIKGAIDQAISDKADLICFGEMAVSGLPALDLLKYRSFLDRTRSVLADLEHRTDDIAILIGAPFEDASSDKRSLYSGVFFIENGKTTLVGKRLIFSENHDVKVGPHGDPWGVVRYKDKSIGIKTGVLGERTEENIHWPYPEERPDFILDFTPSVFDQSVFDKRFEYFKELAMSNECAVVYINHCGAQASLVYDGGSMVITDKGEIVELLPFFREKVKTVDMEETYGSIDLQSRIPSRMKRIYDALVLGVADYFSKNGFEKAILGLSGGLDSALVCVLAVRALGADNVRAVYLKGPFSSDHSAEDARKLASNLGVHFDEIDILKSYQTINQTLIPIFGESPFDVTEENIQARIRGLILMAISNKKGYVVLNASNKSEAAVGYTTLYGDMVGGLSVIGDIYKSEVFELAEYINREEEVIPHRILTKPPSAELRPDQKDSDSLPDYDILDAILYAFVEESKSAGEIIEMGYDPEWVNKILTMVNRGEYKRKQAAPVIRISKRAFEVDRRIPIVHHFEP